MWILTVEPEKMKFAEIGRNPRNVGRKAHKVHQCDCLNIVFIDARAFAEHGGERNTWNKLRQPNY